MAQVTAQAMETRIGRLRVPAEATGGPVSSRLRAEALLATLPLEPAGLPDRSVLVLRSMRIPAGPSARSYTADRLRSMRSRAIRPLHCSTSNGTLPYDAIVKAEAILFEDEVELLASLTRDAVAGVAGERWYWQNVPVNVAPARTAGEVIADAWLSWPRWIPGAVASMGVVAAIAAVSTLSPGQSRRIRAAVAAEYLPGIGASTSASPNVDRQDRQQNPGESSAGAWQASAPWREWLTLPETLEPESAALLGLLTGLLQAARVTRDFTFHKALQDWVDRQVDTLVPDAQPAPGLSGAATRRPYTAHTDTADVDTGAASGDARLDNHAPNKATLTSAAETIALERGGAVDVDEGAMPTPRPTASAADEVLHGTDAADGSHREHEGAVQSQYASLFFLVNLLDRLQPADGVPLPAFLAAPSGWALLELVGRELLAGAGADASGVDEDDAIWSVLAELDGREPGTAATGALGDLASRGSELLDSAAISLAALARPGLILLTRTHLDVVLDIETIDMAVRVSGLDRDPGWVPELGRIIQFHFEAGVTDA